MDRGYLKMWRKSLDSEIFHNPELWRMWSWCLMKTSHKTRFVPFQTGKGKISVKVDAGQFIFGRNKAADFLGDSPSTIWKRMKKLESLGNITIDSSNKQYSIVTICNWEEYQQDKVIKVTGKEQASDNQVTTEEQLSDTNKNVKKDKNVGEVKIKPTKKSTFNPQSKRPDWITEEDWSGIILQRKNHKNKPPETERAYGGIINQLELASSEGFVVSDCIKFWLENTGWSTFKLEWMVNAQGASNQGKQRKSAQTQKQQYAIELLEDMQ